MRRATEKLESRCFAVSGNDSPAAPGGAFEYRRAQSERLRRDAADPKVDARNGNGDENGIRTVCRAGKVGVIGVDPTPPDLRRTLVQRGSR